MADFFAFFAVLIVCFILDLIFFPMICSFQDVSGWEFRKIVRDLLQAQKRNILVLRLLKRLCAKTVVLSMYPVPVHCRGEVSAISDSALKALKKVSL